MTGKPVAPTRGMTMITAAVFDTKPYDRKQFQCTPANSGIEWRFWEFRLAKETAPTAKGAQAVCVFVNDQLDRPCLECWRLRA